ncbi:MAG TPA: aminotransferase class V-fold PLP-dependent enzyme [Vicinamibacterales bacterium]|nr:aminotransferase class V-fold PLP-dependent enzyme [Acidobacteriota bacterium]OQA87982.1 MAG: putative cysteine desulfurase [bacterium ADurb.Bin236]HOC19521.1 aminotransferase class V-fold PLP-dependent enzyme [Vicinamibacterales bacterium]
MDMIYLDNAATSFPKPEETYVFMDRFYRTHGVNPGRSGFDLCMETGHLVDETRALLTRFFNGTDPNRLVFGYNSTDALNLALFGLLAPGDHAITTTLEHNAVLRPLYHLEALGGVAVDYVRFDGRGLVDPGNIERAIRPNTKVVALNHASNVIGTVQPVAEIGRICRERGVRLVVDASQTAGKIPIDVQAMHVDVLCFTGHKSLMGPMGIGGMYVQEGVEIRHTRAGGTGVRSAHRAHLDEYPWRMEYGTPNVLGIAGLNAGVKWIESRGLEAIDAHEMRLTRRLVEGLREIPGVRLYCQDDLENHIAVVLFNVEGFEAGNTGTILDVDHNIACRTGLHCAPLVHEQIGTAAIHGGVRFGIGPFNTDADIDAAIAGVREIAAARART